MLFAIKISALQYALHPTAILNYTACKRLGKYEWKNSADFMTDRYTHKALVLLTLFSLLKQYQASRPHLQCFSPEKGFCVWSPWQDGKTYHLLAAYVLYGTIRTCGDRMCLSTANTDVVIALDPSYPEGVRGRKLPCKKIESKNTWAALNTRKWGIQHNTPAKALKETLWMGKYFPKQQHSSRLRAIGLVWCSSQTFAWES